MNSFGNLFRLTTFGESHGVALGGVIDGFPAGISIDLNYIQSELDRRKPGQSSITTQRKESDTVEILSGVFEGRSTGVSIGFIIRNDNQRSADYDNMRHVFRPSHADYTYAMKYGVRDHRGGGRTSARETVCRVVAGAFAKLALKELGVSISGYTSQIGAHSVAADYTQLDLSLTETNPARCPDPAVAEAMIRLVEEVKRDGDTVGGVVTCVIRGTPVGLGEPVFNKLHADLASSMLSINAAKAFELGMGFEGCAHRGSEMNDPFAVEEGRVVTLTNHSGGIQGGISNGSDIYFRVGFKPVATQLKPIYTIDSTLNSVELSVKGRHDPCVVPRAVPIVEAMAAIVILDHYLLNQSKK